MDKLIIESISNEMKSQVILDSFILFCKGYNEYKNQTKLSNFIDQLEIGITIYKQVVDANINLGYRFEVYKKMKQIIKTYCGREYQIY